jgi:hypothetical protein
MYMNRPTFRKERKRQGSIAHIQERLQRCRPEYKSVFYFISLD